MAEFIIVWPTILLLLLGSLQFGFIFWARATLNLATFQATRAGALENASVTVIEDEIYKGITPLFTIDDTSAAIETAYTKAQTEATYIKVERLNPTADAFTDHGLVINGISQIPNDNLMYRSTSAGYSSGISIQDANLLKVKVTYGYKLLVPLASVIIINLMKATDNVSFHTNTLYPDRRLPIVSYATIRMQTPAYQ